MPAADADDDLVRDEPALFVQRRVRLGDHDLLFPVGRQVVDDVATRPA